MATLEDLANVIFPENYPTIEELEKKFPKRNLSEGAEVTRFAPSPTGFLHLGSLFSALISNKIAMQSKGINILRIEDTDTKREIENAVELLINGFKEFNVSFNEGFLNKDVGDYGPYKQSERKNIYKAVIKEMIKKDLAYPCFCSPEDLEATRQIQERFKQLPGYYGEYAKCRNLTPDEAIAKIKAGEKFVMRYKSHGNHNKKIRLHDEIRGNIDIQENDLDVVILKGDDLPTYHFAHVCDDHFMRTTLVTRGEEWISSFPLHIDMFNALGFPILRYAHLPVISKLDEGKKRKLSKRKDPEANVTYFIENGYPTEVVLVYLMSIANYNFEDYLRESKSFDISNFQFTLKNMSLDGALFDNDKLAYFSKEFISHLKAEDLCNRIKKWAEVYDKDLLNVINSDENKFIKILNIEREKENPRKDYSSYKDVWPLISFFYNDKYEEMFKNNVLPFKETIKKDVISSVLTIVKTAFTYSEDEQSWFNIVKEIGSKNNFALNNKDYKSDPSKYNGNIGDVAEIIRIALTTSKQSPNLYNVFQILGKDEVNRRIDLTLNKLNN